MADAVLPLASLDDSITRLAPFGDGNPEPLFVSEPLQLTQSGSRWSADARPELFFEIGHGVQLLEGARCRLLYSVDDHGRVTVKGCEPESKRAGDQPAGRA
jgi:hypothetical protein